MFLNVCHLCGIDTTSQQVMFSLMHKTSLRCTSFFYFMDFVVIPAEYPDMALAKLEEHFLDDCSKGSYDELRLELSFNLMKSRMAVEKAEVTYRNVLNYPYNHISKLAVLRIGSGHSSDVTSKSITEVRRLDAFKLIIRDPRSKYRQ